MSRPDHHQVTPLFLDAKIVLSSDPRFLAMVRHAVAELTAELGWNESESRAITLAVEEAFTNKIRHACADRPEGRIQFEFHTEPGALVFRLTDQGAAPDPALICARRPESLKPGGFGTHIIRDVMDRVVYETTAEGNSLTMTKFLPG